MSEDEPIQPLNPNRLTVKVSRDPEIESLRQELENVRSEKETLEGELGALAQNEFDKVKGELISRYPEKESVIAEVLNPSELTLIETLLSDEPEIPKKIPSGTVSLQAQNREPDLMRKPFNTPKELMDAVYSEARSNPEMDAHISELFRKSLGKGKAFELQEPPPRVKSPSDRYFLAVNEKGQQIYIPLEHRSLSETELKRRISIGYYG